MQAWDYEKASIQEHKNAKVVQCAVDQTTIDLSHVKVIGASLYSKTVPLPNENLRIKGPRWYVKVDIHNLNDGSKAETLYRVWCDQGEWKAARVETL